jgi:hypothetical protein
MDTVTALDEDFPCTLSLKITDAFSIAHSNYNSVLVCRLPSEPEPYWDVALVCDADPTGWPAPTGVCD